MQGLHITVCPCATPAHLVCHNVWLQHRLGQQCGAEQQLAQAATEAPACRLPAGRCLVMQGWGAAQSPVQAAAMSDRRNPWLHSPRWSAYLAPPLARPVTPSASSPDMPRHPPATVHALLTLLPVVPSGSLTRTAPFPSTHMPPRSCQRCWGLAGGAEPAQLHHRAACRGRAGASATCQLGRRLEPASMQTCVSLPVPARQPDHAAWQGQLGPMRCHVQQRPRRACMCGGTPSLVTCSAAPHPCIANLPQLLQPAIHLLSRGRTDPVAAVCG